MDNFRPKFYYSRKPSTTKRPARRTLFKQAPEITLPTESAPAPQPRLAERPKLRQQLRQPSDQASQTASYSAFAGRSFNVGQTLRASDPSERDNLKKLRARRKKILKLLRYSLFGLVLMTIFVRFFVFKIEVHFAEFKTEPDTAKYQTAIASYLSRQPFERLSFNIDKNHLERAIQAESPEVLQIKQITSGFLRPTRFELALRQPVATMFVNQQRYFVDAAGVPFSHNYHQAPEIEINDQSGIRQSGQLNQQLISGRFLRFIGRAIALTSEKGHQITTATIPTGTVHQIEFKVKGFDLYIKMTIDREVAEQVEDLTRSLDYIKRTGLKPQYLDVRVINKVFYK